MNLQTFKAPTMAEALRQVKSAMGPDAVILHTRTYQKSMWLGLRRKEMVEITAGRGLNVLPPSRRAGGQAPARRPAPPRALPAAYAGAGTSPAEAGGVALPGKQLLEMPAVNGRLMLDLSDKVQSLQAMVQSLSLQVRRQSKPQVPEELYEYYQRLTDSLVGDELAVELTLALHRQLRPEHLRQPEFVRQRLVDLLEKHVPAAGPITRTKTTGPHVIALIGPTGVGKTTTIAKLAANLKLREKHRVGLITIDTYRIAAIDQLKKYADIIGSRLRVVSSPEDLRDAVESMNDCEYILIDTAGRSPNDTLKLHELKNFLASAAPDEVHLVLSSTCSEPSLDLAVARFGDVRIDRLIFTKLDEASDVGVVLNVLRKVGKPLSYVTTGQDVPDDIEIGNGRKLARMILG